MIVGFCEYMTALAYIKFIALLTSEHICRCEACAEFDPLDPGNTEHKLRDIVFKSVKDRRTYSCRNIDRATLYDSAERLAVFGSLANIPQHCPAFAVVDHGKLLLPNAYYCVAAETDSVKRVVLYIVDTCYVRPCVNSAAFEYLRT